MVPGVNVIAEISSGEKFQVLFVISSESLGQLSKKYLERPGLLEVKLVYTGNEALNIVQKEFFDVILSDYDLEDMDAITLHMGLQNLTQKIPFLLFNTTDYDREALDVYAKTPLTNSAIEQDVSIIFNEQSQKIAQTVELFRARNSLELYTRHLEDLVEERTRQLQIAQRFAVIGELATIVGHDMRNPLQVITNMHYLLDMKIKKMPPEESSVLLKNGIPDIFSRIGIEVLYLNKIVSDLQDYARNVNIEDSKINVGTFFEELLQLNSVPPHIKVVKQFEADNVISADPLLVSRVMKNLINNAIQAMGNEGILTLKTCRVGDTICVTITDTGVGIPSEFQSKIFDPLFTTKPKGTGLGLSVTKRLIEAQGGTITLADTSSNGTSFKLTFPIQQ